MPRRRQGQIGSSRDSKNHVTLISSHPPHRLS